MKPNTPMTVELKKNLQRKALCSGNEKVKMKRKPRALTPNKPHYIEYHPSQGFSQGKCKQAHLKLKSSFLTSHPSPRNSVSIMCWRTRRRMCHCWFQLAAFSEFSECITLSCVCARAHARPCVWWGWGWWKEPTAAFRSAQGAFQVLPLKW